MADIRPVPHDPSRVQVESFFDMNAEDWHLTTKGDYATGAAETMRYDGSNWQRVILLEWPARLNKQREEIRLRLMISPEDAEGLAAVLDHTARWLRAVTTLESGEGTRA